MTGRGQFVVMDETERNPSPPPGFLEAEKTLGADRIGETVFSRHWVFQCLLNALKAAENESANGEADMEEVVELDKEVEQELCTLWDMAANSDVARFLHEFKAFEIFLQIIKTSRSPRLVEILVGILGNMAVFPDLSLALSQEDSMLQMALQLLGGSDAPTLLQVLRLCHTCLANRESLPLWLAAIRGADSCLPHITFILGNSINEELLKVCFQVLDCVVDEDPSLCSYCVNEEFVTAVFAAAGHLSAMEKQEFLDAFWHLLHVLDYETDIRDMLVPWRDKLETLLFDWLQGQGQESPTLPPRSCWRTLGTGLMLVTDLRDTSRASASQPLARNLCRRLQEMYQLLQSRLQEAQAEERLALPRADSLDDSFHLLNNALERALNPSS
ncbi:unnamed protein product [Ixodes persulcatus]